LIEFLSRKEVFAALENTAILNRNLNQNLHAMEEIIVDILQELNALEK
jgi:hypothetical protein